jgi:menaquinone-dependent protoporphyrinogen oxidase
MAEPLRSAEFSVDLHPAKVVHSLANYSAVILGAPLYMFHWHADARKFLVRHKQALTSLPVSIFALGPFHNQEKELQSAREQLDKELLKFSWLKPASIQVFVGKFDPASLRFPYSLIGPLKKMPASDERDWQAIQAWIKEVATELSTRSTN